MRRWRFALPPSRRGHPAWGIASVVLHAALVLLLLVYSGPSFVRRTVRRIDLGEGGTAERQVVLPPVPPGPRAAAGTGHPARAVPRDTTPLRPREVVLAPPREVPRAIPAPEAEAASAARGEEGAAPGPADSTAGRRALLRGPQLGDGRLWVRPEEAILAAIVDAMDAAEPDSAEHLDRLEHAVAARIYAFLDTLPRDSMRVAAPPDWTTEINGQTWGIDGEWIHLGGLKLPTMILALLPLPQGNFEQGRRAEELQRIRDDILQAAWRAQTAEQFRRYVEETRARRDAERERERNRRVVPKDSVRT